MTDDNKPAFRLPKPSLRQRRLIAMSSAAAFVVVSLGAFAFLPPAHQVQVADHAPIQLAQASPRATPRMLENNAPFSFADLVERVSPAVVSIRSETMTTQSDTDDESIPAPFRDFFNQFGQGQRPQQPRRAVSAGSGFIIDKAGYVVTNNHVIDSSKKITITLPDKREFTAKLVGTDPSTDIALLKINSDKPLPSVDFGDDKRLRVGDWVVAVGNPFGLSNSVTAGIVSSIGRNIDGSSQAYTNFIQIDAPINRGNSGGPTFDIHGAVVGVNTAIYSPTGGSVGIGFAIPSNLAKPVIAELKEHGKVERGWLGVRIQEVTDDIAEGLGMKSTAGALVAGVTDKGPAAEAGIQAGDVIVEFDGQKVEAMHELPRLVADEPIGKEVPVKVVRKGEEKTITVKPGKLEDGAKTAAADAPDGAPAEPPAKAIAGPLGLTLSDLSPDAREKFGIKDSVVGVVVTEIEPGSAAAEKRLQPGDVIVEVAQQAVKTPDDVQKRIDDLKKDGRKSALFLLANKDGDLRFVAVKID